MIQYGLKSRIEELNIDVAPMDIVIAIDETTPPFTPEKPGVQVKFGARETLPFNDLPYIGGAGSGLLEEFEPNKFYSANTPIRGIAGIYAANADFQAGADFDPADWTLAADIETLILDFEAEKEYRANTVIANGGKIYRAKTDFVAGTEFDANDWELLTVALSVVNDFTPDTAYVTNETITNGGKIYRAKQAFTSGAEFDPADWDLISEALSIVNDFVADMLYLEHEIITHENKIYRASVEFTSGADFDPADWELISETLSVVNDFAANTNYITNEIITNEGKIYRAKQAFTAGTEFDPADWDLISEALSLVNDFAPDTLYIENEIITNGGKIYRAKAEFTSGAEFDPADWDLISEALSIVNDFAPDTAYLLNETITNGGKIYRAKADFVSGADFDANDWDLISEALSIINDFAADTAYITNEVITNGSKIYRAKQAFTSGAEFDPADWDLISEITSIVNDFTPNTAYLEHEIIAEAGKLYRAIADFTSSASFDVADWELVTEATSIVNDFAADTAYLQNEVITHDHLLYRAKVDFVSGVDFDVNDWELISEPHSQLLSFQADFDYLENDMIEHDGRIYRAIENFTSGAEFVRDNWQQITYGSADISFYGSTDLLLPLSVKDNNGTIAIFKAYNAGSSSYTVEATDEATDAVFETSTTLNTSGTTLITKASITADAPHVVTDNLANAIQLDITTLNKVKNGAAGSIEDYYRLGIIEFADAEDILRFTGKVINIPDYTANIVEVKLTTVVVDKPDLYEYEYEFSSSLLTGDNLIDPMNRIGKIINYDSATDVVTVETLALSPGTLTYIYSSSAYITGTVGAISQINLSDLALTAAAQAAGYQIIPSTGNTNETYQIKTDQIFRLLDRTTTFASDDAHCGQILVLDDDSNVVGTAILLEVNNEIAVVQYTAQIDETLPNIIEHYYDIAGGFHAVLNGNVSSLYFYRVAENNQSEIVNIGTLTYNSIDNTTVVANPPTLGALVEVYASTRSQNLGDNIDFTSVVKKFEPDRVKDIYVNGNSVVNEDGIANIDIADKANIFIDADKIAAEPVQGTGNIPLATFTATGLTYSTVVSAKWTSDSLNMSFRGIPYGKVVQFAVTADNVTYKPVLTATYDTTYNDYRFPVPNKIDVLDGFNVATGEVIVYLMIDGVPAQTGDFTVVTIPDAVIGTVLFEESGRRIDVEDVYKLSSSETIYCDADSNFETLENIVDISQLFRDPALTEPIDINELGLSFAVIWTKNEVLKGSAGIYNIDKETGVVTLRNQNPDTDITVTVESSDVPDFDTVTTVPAANILTLKDNEPITKSVYRNIGQVFRINAGGTISGIGKVVAFDETAETLDILINKLGGADKPKLVDLSSQCNGLIQDFTYTDDILSIDHVEVFFEGLKLTSGRDYTIDFDNKTLTTILSVPPISGNTLEIIYTHY